MTITSTDILISAITEENPFMHTNEFFAWFEQRKQTHRFEITPIPFADMNQWGFNPDTGNLAHYTGRFFIIEGIWVETNYGYVPQWTQPIINQPEIGILGIIAKKFNGILYFLMQAKMEPGNINMIQLAPTLQATRSNFTQVHKGRVPPYLEYFIGHPGATTIVDILQSEQGARFLRKRNRNIIVEMDEDVPVQKDYCWLTLGQIQKIMRYDNIINMDARTVLSCIHINDEPPGYHAERYIEHLRRGYSRYAQCQDEVFGEAVLVSTLDHTRGLHSNDEIISWFTNLKFRYDLTVEKIPMKYLTDWTRTDHAIYHVREQFFSVIAVRVEADNREVGSWTQPLVKPCGEGIVAFIIKSINGVLHFLIQGKVEPGNFDVIEMAPTVQCVTGSYHDAPPDKRPPFLDYLLNVDEAGIRYKAKQSEEGGRFYREQNLNMIVEVEDDFPVEVPDNYIWMTANQIKTFIKYNNFVNVQARCLLSCLGLL